MTKEIKMQENPLIAPTKIDPVDEAHHAINILGEVGSLAELNKTKLAAKRQEVELKVDNEKLDAAQKAMDGIDAILSQVMEPTTLRNVSQNIHTPQDLKMMVDSADKMATLLGKMMSPEIADEFSTRKKKKIVAQFNMPGGGSASIGIADE